MKVTIGHKFPGNQPYEMHSLLIEVDDSDLSEGEKTLPLDKRIMLAAKKGAMQTVAFAYTKGTYNKEEAITALKRLNSWKTRGKKEASQEQKPQSQKQS